MNQHRYGRGPRGGGYGGEYGRPGRGGSPRGYDGGYRARNPYDAGYTARDPYDAGYAARLPRVREPAPEWPAFIPFGWNPMARWSGWDPGMGVAPHSPDPMAGPEYGRMAAPRGTGGGLRPGPRGYDRGMQPGPRGYGREFQAAPRRVDPRQSPTWGRGGDDAVREWARRHGYGMEYIIEPRPRRR